MFESDSCACIMCSYEPPRNYYDGQIMRLRIWGSQGTFCLAHREVSNRLDQSQYNTILHKPFQALEPTQACSASDRSIQPPQSTWLLELKGFWQVLTANKHPFIQIPPPPLTAMVSSSINGLTSVLSIKIQLR